MACEAPRWCTPETVPRSRHSLNTETFPPILILSKSHPRQSLSLLTRAPWNTTALTLLPRRSLQRRVESHFHISTLINMWRSWRKEEEEERKKQPMPSQSSFCAARQVRAAPRERLLLPTKGSTGQDSTDPARQTSVCARNLRNCQHKSLSPLTRGSN